MKIPLQTTNMAMGIALFLAGVKPWLDKHFGIVVYDEKTLERLGVKTIKEAMAKGLCGERVLNFDQSDGETMKNLQEIWDDERTRIEHDLPSPVNVTPEDMVRVTARVLHCRKMLTKNWQELPIFAHVRTGAPVEEGSEERRITVHPGFQMVSIRASHGTMAKLGFIEPEPEDEEEEVEA